MDPEQTGAAASGHRPAPSDYTTITSVLRDYEEQGFDGNVTVTEEGLLRCPSCRQEVRPEDVELHSLRRLEGASDPADMAAVLAIACPSCDRKGVAVVKYGPEASPGEAAVLLAIEDRRDDRGLPGATPGDEDHTDPLRP